MNDPATLPLTESASYRRPIRRAPHHVSDRELVLLNFIRNQANRLQPGNGVEVSLMIERDSLKWEIGERW